MHEENVMDIHMSDIMLHIDEELNSKEQSILESQVRKQKGVVGLGYHDTRPHLMIIEYNLETTSPKKLLHTVKGFGLHAEIVGFL